MREDSSRSILIVEDELNLAETIQYNLEREGYVVALAGDGHKGIQMFHQVRPSLVILDLMLPGMPGLDVCRLIRSESSVPILILTAKDAESDKVAGLEVGADDYVTKPFSIRELVSRVRALLRRAEMSAEPSREGSLRGGPVELDPDRHEATVRGQTLQLTPKEFSLLEILMERKGRLLTRDFLIDEIWGPEYVGDTKTLDVHIKRLREKIEEDPRNPAHLTTVRGLGYKFVD